MHTLRYWLGIPLLNLILVLLIIVFPVVMPSRTTCGGLFVTISIYTYMVMIFGGAFVLPLLTGIYYPAGRWDCRPLWGPAMASFLGIFVLWTLALTIFSSGGITFFLIIVIALAAAVVETVGYSIGLLIAGAIANRKTKA